MYFCNHLRYWKGTAIIALSTLFVVFAYTPRSYAEQSNAIAPMGIDELRLLQTYLIDLQKGSRSIETADLATAFPDAIGRLVATVDEGDESGTKHALRLLATLSGLLPVAEKKLLLETEDTAYSILTNENRDLFTRLAAQNLLLHLPDLKPSTILGLATLSNHGGMARVRIHDLLARYYSSSSAARTALIVGLQHEDSKIRSSAIGAIAKVPEVDDALLSALIPIITSNDSGSAFRVLLSVKDCPSGVPDSERFRQALVDIMKTEGKPGDLIGLAARSAAELVRVDEYPVLVSAIEQIADRDAYTVETRKLALRIMATDAPRFPQFERIANSLASSSYPELKDEAEKAIERAASRTPIPSNLP